MVVPAEQLPAEQQCRIDRGFRLVRVLAPQVEGDEPAYKFETDLPDAEAIKITEECRKLEPERPEKTDAEIRVIYDRWVGERKCLVQLGYEPDAPPSFETFLSDWRTMSPSTWSPIQGVDTGAWSAKEYETAKKKCTLEMYDRD